MSYEITVEGGSSKKLLTAGKYCDRDIIVTATGGGLGNIFGTSKCEVGSVIGTASTELFVSRPSWVSNLDNLNVVAFTRATYAWDSAYYTVIMKIIRAATTFSGYSTNDGNTFSESIVTIAEGTNGNLRINPGGSSFSVPGAEYFYIIWENE